MKRPVRLRHCSDNGWYLTAQEPKKMLYIFESAFDEVEAVSREAREKLSGLETVLKSTSESLQVLKERLEQTAS